MTIISCIVPQIWSATERIFCHSGLFFVLLPPTSNSQKNQNFEKMKTKPGVIILHMHTINDNHMSVANRIFLSFWPIFALLLPPPPPPYPYPPNNPKNQLFEKIKQIPWDIIILHKCCKNHDHILYCSWDLVRNQKSFSSLDLWFIKRRSGRFSPLGCFSEDSHSIWQ